MIICPHCAKPNPEGTLFCEECGEPFVATSTETRAISQRAAPAVPDRVIVDVHGYKRNFIVEMLDAPVILGRADQSANFFPEIELTPFDAVRLGVSRRHAMMSWGAMGVTLEDLGSYNGTFVNGRRLAPGERFPLSDNDELVLGDLVLYVRFKHE